MKKSKKKKSVCKSYDIVSVGSATVDVFAKTESELIKIKTLKSEEDLIAYPSGSKILITHLAFLFGGGGTNTAVSFSKLGLRTAFLGKVGRDDNGEKIMKHLKREKVDFVGAVGHEMTAYSVVLDSIEEDRTILAFKGASNNLHFRELKCGSFNTKWFYFSSMVDESYKTLEKLALFAKKNKIKIAFNPSNYLCEKGVSFLRKILSSTEVIVLNDEEAKLLVGSGSVKDHLKALHRLGPKTVVITMGRKGAVASDGGRFYEMKPPRVKVHETTGAGDAFAAGFVTGMIKKGDVEFALKLGSVNAAGCISHYGAQMGLPQWDRAMQMMKRINPRVKRL
ncbi:carbohydrate kinase family protein [Candidatus Woesearchaeota archaeon]|nr:carbohydrate kinase family protein [Candidatus Woesearchaeota archaeon]